ncbi:MAG: tyrosine-type recombinase/integrase [Dehalococcoidia bacterium]
MDCLTDLVALYLLRCEVEGKSPPTIRAYRETLSRFLDAVEVEQPDEVTAEQLYRYLGRFTHLSLETRHRYFREVRCFFNWLVDNAYLERSPFRGMRNVRLPQRLVEPFAPEEIASLLDCCDTTPVGLRDRALLLVLLDTGARCSEVVQLSVSDLNLEGRRLRIRFGKGNKQRVVPFADRCEASLRAYVAVRGLQPGPLFLAATGHRRLTIDTALQPNGLKQMLRRLGRTAGVRKVHAHRFRHTFATWAIQHDARELDVQYLLGHSSPDMVRRYSSTYRSEQAAMRHAAFSPGDQMTSHIGVDVSTI